MKKYLLVSLAMLFTAAFVWADEAKEAENLKMDVEGNATLEWGLDLGQGKDARKKHGFNNKADIKVTVPIIKKGNKTSKGDAPVYAEVEIGELEMNVEGKAKDDGPGDASNDVKIAGNVKKINAKLNFYGAYLTIYDKPSFKTNYASIWEPIKKNDDYKDNFKYEPGFNGFGTKLGYKNEKFLDLDVGVKFGSIMNMDGKKAGDDDAYEWKEQEIDDNGAIKKIKVKVKKDKKESVPTVDANYMLGLDFSMKPVKDLFEFKVSANATLDDAKYYEVTKAHGDKEVKAIGMGAEITSKPVKGLEFKFGFDGGTGALTRLEKDDKGNNKKVGFAWDTMFTAKYKWVSGGIYVASVGTPFAGAIYNEDKKVYDKDTTDIGLFAKFETKGDKPEDANFLVKGLEAGAYLGVYNLLSSSSKKDKENGQVYPMLMKLSASYQMDIASGMWIKPYGELWGETNHTDYFDGTEGDAKKKRYFGVMYKLGVAFQPVEKVEINAFWQHGKAEENNRAGSVLTPVQHKADNGRVKLAVKVKF